MDVSRFTDRSPGRLVPIDDDVAFVPYGLADTWAVPNSLTHLWVAAREALGELRGTSRTLPDPGLLLRPMRQREAIRSSSLEGTYATPEELLAYEMDPRDPLSAKDPANAWREVFNYQEALELGQHLVDEGYPLSEWLIRQMHERLLVGVRGADKSPGKIREEQVHIGIGHRFNPSPPAHLPELMGQLERDIQAPKNTDPLIRALMVHYQFETIHPFRDGNGRVGRLLLALMIYKDCDFDKPWLYLSEFFDRNRDDYIDALFHVSAHNDWERWIGFGLRATVETARKTITRLNGLLALKDNYEERIRNLDGRDRLMHMIPKLLSQPMITYKDLMESTDVTYPTARGDMDALIEAEILSPFPMPGKRKRFIANEIFRLAYFDD